VSRLGAAVEGSHSPKRPPSCAYKAPRRSPLCWSIFSLTPSSCALRYSFAIYPFPRVDQRPDFDGVYVLSTDRPQLYRRNHRQVLEASAVLRCVDVRLCRSFQSVCDGRTGVDEWPSVLGAISCRLVTPTCLRGRALGGWRSLRFRRRRR
jgi:hypothetical protein